MTPAQFKYISIFETIYTKDQAEEFEKQLDRLLTEIFNTNVQPEKKIEELFSYEVKEGILTTLRNNNIDINDPMGIKVFLVPLKDILDRLPHLTLQLAFEPTSQMLKKISNFFIEKLNKKYLLDIQLHKEIIGGAVFIMNGATVDYSLRRRIEDLYKSGSFISFLENNAA